MEHKNFMQKTQNYLLNKLTSRKLRSEMEIRHPLLIMFRFIIGYILYMLSIIHNKHQHI